MAALSYVYDNGLEKSVVQKAIVGFRYSTIILFLLSCIKMLHLYSFVNV